MRKYPSPGLASFPGLPVRHANEAGRPVDEATPGPAEILQRLCASCLNRC